MNIFKSEYMNSKWLLFHIQKRKKKKSDYFTLSLVD